MTSIIAHRGASSDAPENTLEAFRLAWEHGADAIEMDLRLSRDGRVMVIHDEDLRRLAGDTRRVRDVDAAELVEMDVSRSRPGHGVAARIPLLADAIKNVPAGKGVFLELKEDETMLPALREVIEDSELASSQITLISFNLPVLVRAKVLMPDLNSALIVDWPSVLGYERLMKMVLENGINGLDVATKWFLNEHRVAQAHDQGLTVHVWTVDDFARGRELSKAGVDGIATNTPLRMRQMIEA